VPRSGEYRCEALLRMRRRREAAAAQAFAQARADAEACRHAADELAAARAGHEAAARAVLMAGRSCPALHRACAADLLRALAAGRTGLAQAEADSERAREELIEAMRRRKALSCLKQRLDRLRGAEAARRQANEADDLHAAHRAAAAG
jgi:flagellar export protein FliJ